METDLPPPPPNWMESAPSGFGNEQKELEVAKVRLQEITEELRETRQYEKICYLKACRLESEKESLKEKLTSLESENNRLKLELANAKTQITELTIKEEHQQRWLPLPHEHNFNLFNLSELQTPRFTPPAEKPGASRQLSYDSRKKMSAQTSTQTRSEQGKWAATSDIVVVTLTRRNVHEGFGFGLHKGGTARGAVIGSITPGGIAYAAGLRVGDVIILANGESLVGLSVDDITRKLRNTDRVLELAYLQTPKPKEPENRPHIQQTEIVTHEPNQNGFHFTTSSNLGIMNNSRIDQPRTDHPRIDHGSPFQQKHAYHNDIQKMQQHGMQHSQHHQKMDNQRHMEFMTHQQHQVQRRTLPTPTQTVEQDISQIDLKHFFLGKRLAQKWATDPNPKLNRTIAGPRPDSDERAMIQWLLKHKTAQDARDFEEGRSVQKKTEKWLFNERSDMAVEQPRPTRGMRTQSEMNFSATMDPKFNRTHQQQFYHNNQEALLQRPKPQGLRDISFEV